MKSRTIAVAAAWMPIFGVLIAAVVIVVLASEMAECGIAMIASERDD